MTARIGSKKHKFFRKPCRRCDRMFRPTTKFSYICPSCISKYNEWMKSGRKSGKNQNYEEYLKND